MKLTYTSKIILIILSLLIIITLFVIILFKLLNQVKCVYELPNGRIIDLSPLKSNKDYILKKGYHTIRANICSRLNEPCETSDSKYSPISLILSNNKCFSLSSKWGNIDMISQADSTYKLSLDYGDRCYKTISNFKANYNFKCDENIDIKLLTFSQPSLCNFNIEFATKYVCNSYYEQQSTIFGAQMILIIITILFTIYLFTFTYFNYRRNPEDGIIKALPHKEFWKSYFNYMKIGFKITINKIKYCFTGEISNNEYNHIQTKKASYSIY